MSVQESPPTGRPASALIARERGEQPVWDVPETAGGVIERFRHRVTPQQLLRLDNLWPAAMALVIAAYVWHFTRLTLDNHHGLGTASYDLGLYDQGVYLMSRFEAPFVTMMGRNLMGDHTSFILIFLVPFYWLWPSVGVLLFSQAAAIGAGAIPVYLYARRRLEAPWMAFVAGCIFLLHPAVSWTNMENFHPDSFVAVLVGFALYGALERKWKLYAVAVVLALMVKEDVSLVVVPIGIWVAVRRDRRIGLITVLGSVGFMVIAMFVVMRSLIGVSTRNAWRIPFGGPGRFVTHSLTNPTDLWRHLSSEQRPWYLWQMTSPLAFVWARLPDVALISTLVVASNMVSTYFYQYSIMYHYSLIAVPALVTGTVYAIGAMGVRWRPLALGLVAASSLAAGYLWSPLPFSRVELYYWGGDHPVAVGLRDIIDDIPADASVAAYYSAAPHLSHRTEIYQFPTPFRTVLYGVEYELENTRLESRAEGVEYVLLPLTIDAQMQADFDSIAPAFELVATSEGWRLFQRNPTVPLPPLVLPMV